MKQVVFTQKKVMNFLSRNFIPVDLDISHDALPKGFNFIGIPTFFIINQNGKQIGMLVGGMRSSIFLNRLKKEINK